MPFNNWARILSVAVLSVSFVLGMTLVAWYEITEVTHDTPLETTIAIIIKGKLVSAAIVAALEGGIYIVVIAFRMVQQGVEKGRKEAYKDANKQAEDYYKRMREALEAGEDFNEPPPTFGRNGR